MSRPAYRVKTARKDGTMQSYQVGGGGETREAKSLSVGALWPNKFGGFNLSFDAQAIEADPRLKSLSEEFFFNIYGIEDAGPEGGLLD